MASSQEKQTQDAASAATASGQGPPPEEFAQAIEAAKTAASFQDAADALKKQASLVWDPVEREKLLKSAYLKEKAAHGESKKARVMASGWGQGAGFGVGVSAAVGMGAGNLVGALLSGVVAVPGVLIGSGVGAIHGPFVKLKDLVAGNGKKNPDDGDEAVDEKPESGVGGDAEMDSDEENRTHAAIVDAARKLDDEKPSEVTAVSKGAQRADDAKEHSREHLEQSQSSETRKPGGTTKTGQETLASSPSAIEAKGNVSNPGSQANKRDIATDKSTEESGEAPKEGTKSKAGPSEDRVTPGKGEACES